MSAMSNRDVSSAVRRSDVTEGLVLHQPIATVLAKLTWR